MSRSATFFVAAFVFGLVGFAVSSQPSLIEPRIRTIPVSEAQTLIGGDGGPGYYCQTIPDCELEYDEACEDIVVINGNVPQAAQRCGQSFEYVPQTEAGKKECVPGAPEEIVCSETGTNPCNIEYICHWDSLESKCVRSTFIGYIPAPADCDDPVVPGS